MFLYVSLSFLMATLVRTIPVERTIENESKNEIIENTTQKLRDRWVIFFYDKDFVPSISLLPDFETSKQDGEVRIDTRLDWGESNSTGNALLAPLMRAVRSSTTGTTATVIIGKLIEQLRNIGSKFIESLDVERFWNANGTRFDEEVTLFENTTNGTKKFTSD